MKSKYDSIKSDLMNIIKYTNYATLSSKEDYEDGIINLKRLEEEIKNKRQIRYEILKALYEDITNKLLSKKITNFKIYIPSENIFIDKYLNITFEINDNLEKILINKNGIIEYMSNDSKEVLESLKMIIPFIRNFLKLTKEDSIGSLLNNDFYDNLFVSLVGHNYRLLVINGNGINLIEDSSLSNLETKNISEFYNDNKSEILKKVYIFNNTILNRYKTELSKRKVLSLYKRGI